MANGIRKWVAATLLALASLASIGAQEAGGIGQGIKVHGHWVIEVRNPDGGVVERREFENALTAVGARQLALLLARTASSGHWMVSFRQSGQVPGPCPGGLSGSVCMIVESGSELLQSPLP